MRILIVIHGLPPAAQGGAEIHAWRLARHLSAIRGHEITIITREADPSRPERAVRRERIDDVDVYRINNTFRSLRAFVDTYDDDRITRVAAAVIRQVHPDVAHLHHLTCLSTGIVRVLRALAVPCVMTLHDYWLMCHRGQLLDENLDRCAGPGPDGCARCLGPAASAPGWAFAARATSGEVLRVLPPGLSARVRAVAGWVVGARPGAEPQPASTQASGRGATGTDADAATAHAINEPRRRVRHMHATLGCVDRLLAPSRHLLDRFVQFGVPRERVRLVEYGIEHARFQASGEAAVREPVGERADRTVAGSNHEATTPLRLGFLGSLMISKGPHVLLEAIARLPAGMVTLDIYGAHTAYHGDDGYRARLTPLLATPGVRHHGGIPHEAVPRVLGSLDALVVPSIWEENSPLVIREAFAAGVPVLASRIGGIPETVREGAGGCLFTAGDPSDLAAVLTRLATNPPALDALRRAIPRVPDLADEAAALEREWADLMRPIGSSPDRSVPRAERTGHDLPGWTCQTSARLCGIVLNFGSADDTYLAVRSLLGSDRDVDEIVVVDNDQGQPASRVLTGLPTRVTYVPMAGNLGFAGGVNAGIRHALTHGAERVLLVNSDATLRPDCILELETIMRECGAGVVGALVVSRRDPGRIDTAGIFYSHTTGRMLHPEADRFQDQDAFPSARPVDAVSGCVMLIDRRVFEQIGLFDPEFFFGFEDIDFCLRAAARGWPVLVAPRAVAYHEGARSIGAESTDRFYYAARNHLKMAAADAKRRGAVSALTAPSIALLNMAHALRTGGGSLTPRLLATWQGIGDHHRRRYGPRRSER